MSLRLRIVWVSYVAVTIAVAVLGWVERPSAQPDGAGGGTACACLGFLAFLILAAVTRAQGAQGRSKPYGRGSDVILSDDKTGVG